jgi:hypothetical protein
MVLLENIYRAPGAVNASIQVQFDLSAAASPQGRSPNA